jgi:hypothetical protein
VHIKKFSFYEDTLSAMMVLVLAVERPVELLYKQAGIGLSFVSV